MEYFRDCFQILCKFWNKDVYGKFQGLALSYENVKVIDIYILETKHFKILCSILNYYQRTHKSLLNKCFK